MTNRVGSLLVLVLVLGCDDGEPASADSSIADSSIADSSADTGMDVSADAPLEDTAVGTDTAAPDMEVADTWTNFAEAFMTTYCVECHDGMTGAGRDYQVLANVAAEMTNIRCGTSDVTLDDCAASPRARQFPIGRGPSPDDAERARFVAWIDAGLPE